MESTEIKSVWVRCQSTRCSDHWLTTVDRPSVMRLQFGSPAINAGSNAEAVDDLGQPLTSDQRVPVSKNRRYNGGCRRFRNQTCKRVA